MKTIKDMPRHSRPREKLKERGPAALTDEETNDERARNYNRIYV